MQLAQLYANSMAGDRDKALAAGINDHVAKPIDVVVLFEVLGRWVQLPEARRSSDTQTMDASKTAPKEASRLPVLLGVDTQSGLACVGGNVSVHRKILQQFARSQADDSARIRSALRSKDLTSAEQEGHTLKRVSGNIGASEVATAAKHLETAIKHGADTEMPMAELERTHRELIASLTSIKAVSTTSEKTLPMVSAADLLPTLDRLQALLEESNGEAGNLVAELESQAAQTEFLRPFREISECIVDFEHDEALELSDLEDLGI